MGALLIQGMIVVVSAGMQLMLELPAPAPSLDVSDSRTGRESWHRSGTALAGC